MNPDPEPTSLVEFLKITSISKFEGEGAEKTDIQVSILFEDDEILLDSDTTSIIFEMRQNGVIFQEHGEITIRKTATEANQLKVTVPLKKSINQGEL